MSRDHLAVGKFLQVLEPPGTSEPSWMISCQPALRNAIAPLQTKTTKDVVSFLSLAVFSKIKPGGPNKETCSYIFNDVAVIADEKEGARIQHIDLHAHQASRVAREVVQGDALTKVQGLFVKSFPIAVWLRQQSNLSSSFLYNGNSHRPGT